MTFHPAYFETRFRLESDKDRKALLSWVDSRMSFAIITAYATTGEAWSDEQNKAADQTLRDCLAQQDGTDQPIRITGYNPPSSHAEPGWAFPLGTKEAIQLGHQFKQDAIYYVAGDTLSVYSSQEANSDHKAEVASFTNRLDE